MLKALLMDQADFVELFLDNGVRLKDALSSAHNDHESGIITLYQVIII